MTTKFVDVLLFTSLLFGFSGADRIYTGAIRSGVLKLVLFLCWVVTANVTAAEPTTASWYSLMNTALGTIVTVWYALDVCSAAYIAVQDQGFGGSQLVHGKYTYYNGVLTFVLLLVVLTMWVSQS
jgi:TM2 domain-containing membrane protein YozV